MVLVASLRDALRRLALTLVSVYAVASVAVVATYPVLQERVAAEIASIRNPPLNKLMPRRTGWFGSSASSTTRTGRCWTT